MTNRRRHLCGALAVMVALGVSLASGGTAAEDALSRCGYSPADDGRGGLTLDNCPFHALARDFPPLACDLNLELLRGVLEAAGEDGGRARLDPAAGRCCVVISKNNKD